MKYRRLGQSNLKVSELCLGTMMFADQTPLNDARSMVASAQDQGINFIDTADIYSKGKSEEMVGEVLKDCRNAWVLATKLGNAFGNAPNQGRYSRRWIIEQVNASLKRLNTDYIDILYLHRDYHGENLEEAARALGDLIQAGKLHAFGLSNFRGWRIAEFVHVCQKVNVPGPVVCQPYYNLLKREPEVEILPACANYGLGVVPYSPIARGVLTGKYAPGQAPAADSRAGRGDRRIMQTEFREESLQVAQKLQEYCNDKGVKMSHFAVAWVLANKHVSSVIAGPRTLAQLEDYYPAVDLELTPEDEQFIDSLVTPGHASIPGYNDPNYPFFGR
jgi:aryl-alcohol dehydrogenase-like predicted oxidoreductase